MTTSTKTTRFTLNVLGLALVLMMVGATGGAIAAVKIGSSQIADNSIRSRDVRDGTLKLSDLEPGTRTALSGVTGPQGPAGAPGTDGVVQVEPFVGAIGSIFGNSGSYVFAGPPVQVTTTATQTRVTGSAVAGLGLNTGNPQFADVGMCFQPAAGGTLVNFYGSGFGTYFFTTARDTFSSTATKVLSPGSYKVGMCVRNNGGNTLNNNGYVNGWVMVSS